MARKETTTCVIAGGGLAGVVLGLLLARSGVEVVVLERRHELLGDFRAAALTPSTSDVLEALGLAADLRRLPHQTCAVLALHTDTARVPLCDLSRLRRAPHPHHLVLAQWDLLELLATRAQRYPEFTLRTGAEVVGVRTERGRIIGLRYRDSDGVHDITATLTVAADGRASSLRGRLGLRVQPLASDLDVAQLRLSRHSGDPDESFLRVTDGRVITGAAREHYWELDHVVPAGGHRALLRHGIGALRHSVAEALPHFAGRVGEITDTDEVPVARAGLGRLREWYRPGVLVLGDAAHPMSPLGGFGVDLAVQDAVAAANITAAHLLLAQKRGRALPDEVLQRVQQRRWWPTVAAQVLQRLLQEHLAAPAFAGAAVPAGWTRLTRVPGWPRLAARWFGYGLRPEHVATPELASPRGPLFH